MDLILWRHADAEEGAVDLERKLTKKGRKQAARVAEWLLARLPKGFLVIASPAARARETAEALGVRIGLAEALAPGASAADILKAAGWPAGDATVVLVGHQPDLGRAVAHLLCGAKDEWSIKKGGLWWISNEKGLRVNAVISPDLL